MTSWYIIYMVYHICGVIYPICYATLLSQCFGKSKAVKFWLSVFRYSVGHWANTSRIYGRVEDNHVKRTDELATYFGCILRMVLENFTTMNVPSSFTRFKYSIRPELSSWTRLTELVVEWFGHLDFFARGRTFESRDEVWISSTKRFLLTWQKISTWILEGE